VAAVYLEVLDDGAGADRIERYAVELVAQPCHVEAGVLHDHVAQDSRALGAIVSAVARRFSLPQDVALASGALRVVAVVRECIAIDNNAGPKLRVERPGGTSDGVFEARESDRLIRRAFGHDARAAIDQNVLGCVERQRIAGLDDQGRTGAGCRCDTRWLDVLTDV